MPLFRSHMRILEESISSFFKLIHSDILNPHPYITDNMDLCFMLVVTSKIRDTSSNDSTFGSVLDLRGLHKSYCSLGSLIPSQYRI